MNENYTYKLPSLTERELKILLKIVKNTKGKIAERDYVIIFLFLKLGLRKNELTSLNVGDIKEANINGELLIRKETAKRNKKRIVPFHKDLVRCLERFLILKKRWKESIRDDAPLFISKKGNRIANRSINDVIKSWCKMAGIKDITPHGLRHTFARQVIESSEEPIKALLVLKEYLGHNSIATTGIYLKPGREELHDTIDSLPY